ncbi:MAG: hypothetical protein O7E52_15510 [Candidatus Poribacteria bacterium]|nr:hypothetical protein [Candidatus Poribacteria bacterium]
MQTTFQAFLALTLIHANETGDDPENLPDEVVQDDLSTEEASEQEVASDNDKTEDADSAVEHREDEQSDAEEHEVDGGVESEADSIPLNEDTENTPDDAESEEGVTAEASDASEAETGDVEGEAAGAIDPSGDDDGSPTPTDSDEDEKAAEIPLSVGVIDEVYDFVKEFPHSQSSNVEQASASAQDSAGGISKAAIFEHPRTEGDARIEYEVSLPQVKSDENLILNFSIGLRDGVDFESPHTKPDGVQFAIEVSGERRFEGVSVACEWAEYLIDLSDFAGGETQIAFLTNSNGEGNTNYDWALWGNPRVLKLTRVPLPTERGETDPKMRRGLAIGLLAGESPELCVTEFNLETSTLAPQIAHEISQQMQARVSMSIVELALYTEQPKLDIVTMGPAVALVAARADFELQCTIRNNGLVPLEPIHEASVAISRLKLRRGRSVHPLRTLNPGEEATFAWNIRSFSRESIAQASVSLRCQMPTGRMSRTVEKTIAIQPAIPQIPLQTASELHTQDLNGHVITENRHLRAVFVRGSQGFEYCVLSAAKNGRYRQVAVCRAISEIRYRNTTGNVQHIKVNPSIYRLGGNNSGESIVMLSAEEKDDDGVRWSYEARFSLSDGARRLKVEYRLSADQDRELILFSGPILHAGEGDFSENKSFALFPGLEFLEEDEPSSSTRDAAPPINNRLVPHPYKITIPLMAVEHKKTLVGLTWDALQTWDGEHNMLSAAFASPNWHEHQKNHLMGLFLPTPPDWVEENHLEASTPYPMKANHPITLNAQIIIDGNASILDAISHWTDAYGIPEPVEAPRNDAEELLLSRHAFMHTVWDAETAKSRHCVGWAPGNAPGFATLLWYDYLVQTQDEEVKDESVRQRVIQIAENTIRESGEGGLVSPALCHILKWESPFYFGHVEAGLDRVKEIMQRLIDTQGEDGSWRFHPTTDRTKTLGTEGDAVLGTSAYSALMLLKYARITGNTESLEAGLKGLKFMEGFNVPRGAQTWECPLYEPDILAAAYAIGAYVEAYEVTNNRQHLEWAEYWARAGQIFLYHWHLPDRPGMRFASIPVFGTTFYTHAWFGVPVQWNGLVYAYYLQHLARHSSQGKLSQPQSFWLKIAEGITISAMYQQWTEGELKGTYPDGFYGFCTEGRGPHINPEDIVVNLYALRGLDPDISTAILHNRRRRIHLSTGAKIEAFTRDDSGGLSFVLRYVQYETSYSIITGYGGKPAAIRAQNQNIAATDSLESVESGWLYREEKDTIFIKYKQPVGEIDFEVFPPVEVEPPTAPVEEESSPEEDSGVPENPVPAVEP